MPDQGAVPVSAEARVVQRYGYLLLISVLGNVLTLITAVLVSTTLVRTSERKFCAVLMANDSSSPPTTQRGRDIAEKMKVLRVQLGCESD